MTSDVETQAPPSALETAANIVIMPGEALAALRRSPTWGIALLAVLAMTALSAFLMTPAMQFAYTAQWPQTVAKTPALAQMSVAQQQLQLFFALQFVKFSWMFVVATVPVTLLVQAVTMTLANAVGRGEGTFKRYWAAAVNVAIASMGLGSVITAIIVLMRGPQGFYSVEQVWGALPSLATLLHSENARILAVCRTVTPFSVWGAYLSSLALLRIGRVSALLAYSTGIVLLAGSALLAAAFTH